ncbi:hypothetical protein EQG49_12425 [Periweissella cryptocerci]|uniref:Uncharacterized protein n=1 Tax=Periweissella cryptocerci TaxID=2506420 RepID=A0A4P6YWP4_9LACO|nr:hypothetical protein [Periweissella cryptocerci]QBO37203.1 hypothetical protein EQG49_12425 [Periweissella cryptocerci]
MVNDSQERHRSQAKHKNPRAKSTLIIGLAAVALVGGGVLGGYMLRGNNQGKEEPQKVASTVSNKNANNSSKAIASRDTSSSTTSQKNVPVDAPKNLSGTYFEPATADTATVNKSSDGSYEIHYSTADGQVTATFTPKWQVGGGVVSSATPMKKSDGNTAFKMEIMVDFAGSKPLIILTMTDGNKAHTLTFRSEKAVLTDADNKAILVGDLSSFAGQYSNDAFEKAIKDSNYTLGGYTKKDYLENRTTNFDFITKDGYWEGGMHANYTLDKKNLPQKIKGYYKVNLLGANAIAIVGQKISILLIPAGVKAPDGSISDEKRVAPGVDNQLMIRPYHDKWWEK